MPIVKVQLQPAVTMWSVLIPGGCIMFGWRSDALLFVADQIKN